MERRVIREAQTILDKQRRLGLTAQFIEAHQDVLLLVQMGRWNLFYRYCKRMLVAAERVKDMDTQQRMRNL